MANSDKDSCAAAALNAGAFMVPRAPVKRRKRVLTEETRERLRAQLAANRDKAIAVRRANAKRRRELRQMQLDEQMQAEEARLRAWRAEKAGEDDDDDHTGDSDDDDGKGGRAAAALSGPGIDAGLALPPALPSFIDFEAMASYVDAYRANERRQQYLAGRRNYYYQHRERYLEQAKERYERRRNAAAEKMEEERVDTRRRRAAAKA